MDPQYCICLAHGESWLRFLAFTWTKYQQHNKTRKTTRVRDSEPGVALPEGGSVQVDTKRGAETLPEESGCPQGCENWASVYRGAEARQEKSNRNLGASQKGQNLGGGEERRSDFFVCLFRFVFTDFS